MAKPANKKKRRRTVIAARHAVSKREMIIVHTTPAPINSNPPQVARQDAVPFDHAQLFAVPDRRAGYDQGNIEAAEYILADPRRVRNSPLLITWAEAVMQRVRGNEGRQ